MYEDFSDMLLDFGIPLLVYRPADGKAGHLEHGTWVSDPAPEPISVTEPLIVPSSSALQSDQIQYNTGGTTHQYDALWYSELAVTKGTKVKIDKDGGRTFHVNYERDYSDYSDVHCYELRGASNHDDQS